MPAATSAESARRASDLTLRAPGRPSLARLRSIARCASRSDWTKTAVEAPRESASSPIAPEPANRSRTAISSTGPIRLNAASRTRSPVGRVSPLGAKMRAPLCLPAMILTGEPAEDRPRGPGESAHRERQCEVEADVLALDGEVDQDRTDTRHSRDGDGPQPAHPPHTSEPAPDDRPGKPDREHVPDDDAGDETETDRGQPVPRRHLGLHVLACEDTLDLVVQRPFVVDERVGGLARPLEQL